MQSSIALSCKSKRMQAVLQLRTVVADGIADLPTWLDRNNIICNEKGRLIPTYDCSKPICYIIPQHNNSLVSVRLLRLVWMKDHVWQIVQGQAEKLLDRHTWRNGCDPVHRRCDLNLLGAWTLVNTAQAKHSWKAVSAVSCLTISWSTFFCQWSMCCQSSAPSTMQNKELNRPSLEFVHLTTGTSQDFCRSSWRLVDMWWCHPADMRPSALP